ncbi:hypothetical protein AGMMS49545_20830 [Betaproteobacteria bacterium]|nr:hypothetical protein AGMMS49545_20830 [Betaproteobacteria bacterium]
MRIGDGDDIRYVAIGKQPETEAAATSDTDTPTGKPRQLWQIAAVALTLTAAATVLRQIRSRAKAQTARFTTLTETAPFAAALAPKTHEGAFFTLEQLGDDSELRILNEPTQGKLTKGEASYTYQPDNETGNSAEREDRFTYATETGTGNITLHLQSANGLPQIAHVEHDAKPNDYAPVRLTVKASREAPTLLITDPVANEGNSGQVISLPRLQSAPHEQTATTTLSLTLAGFPQSSTVSDGVHRTHLTDSEPVDVTQWNLNTLTFLPPANFSGSFTLSIRVTESQEDQADASTSVSIKVSADTGNGKQRPIARSAGTSNTSSRSAETVSAKVGTVTVHASLPEAKPQEEEPRYLVLNLASNRANQANQRPSRDPKPIINWSGKAPDFETGSMSWVSHLFANTKDKVRSLAERTGLRFKMEER